MAAARERSLRWRIVGALFELLYHSRTLYWLASTVPFAGQWRRWQRLVLPRLRGVDVLEVGCGPGWLLADMAEAGYTCAAVDRSPQMVAAARRELRRRRIASTAASVRHAEVQRLPYASASFDTVVSTFPSDYIGDPVALREILRVLRPGGRLVIVLGARLLPAHAALLPLVALADAVYGRRSRPRAKAPADGAAVPGEPLAARLQALGLVAAAERVNGPFWDAYLVVADKPRLPS
jgi:SAM-dependent methyltransferase